MRGVVELWAQNKVPSPLRLLMFPKYVSFRNRQKAGNTTIDPTHFGGQESIYVIPQGYSSEGGGKYRGRGPGRKYGNGVFPGKLLYSMVLMVENQRR